MKFKALATVMTTFSMVGCATPQYMYPDEAGEWRETSNKDAAIEAGEKRVQQVATDMAKRYVILSGKALEAEQAETEILLDRKRREAAQNILQISLTREAEAAQNKCGYMNFHAPESEVANELCQQRDYINVLIDAEDTPADVDAIKGLFLRAGMCKKQKTPGGLYSVLLRLTQGGYTQTPTVIMRKDEDFLIEGEGVAAVLKEPEACGFVQSFMPFITRTYGYNAFLGRYDDVVVEAVDLNQPLPEEDRKDNPDGVVHLTPLPL